jgi:hypothetical protein
MIKHCNNCELGEAGMPCNFSTPCNSFLPFGWEKMIYLHGKWFDPVELEEQIPELGGLLCHGNDSK